MSDEEDARKIVLARRARFVAAAVASLGVACRTTTSEPCLSPPPLPEPHDAGAEAVTTSADAGPPKLVTEPQVCLTVRAEPREDGSEPSPIPCLSVRVAPPPRDDAGPKPSPAPCLSVPPPTPPKPKPSP
jgi:hypothetical protein